MIYSQKLVGYNTGNDKRSTLQYTLRGSILKKILPGLMSCITCRHSRVCSIESRFQSDQPSSLDHNSLSFVLMTWAQNFLVFHYFYFSDQPILSRFPASLASSHSRSNIQIYSQLQTPSTSNFGSMKKKKKGARTRRDGEEEAGHPAEIGPPLADLGQDAGASYIPDYITINNKPVKV